MSWQAIASKAVFRQPRLGTCSIQAFLAGLFGYVAFLGAIVFIDSSKWAPLIGIVPLSLWGLARSLEAELRERREGGGQMWPTVLNMYLEILLAFGAYCFGGLMLLAGIFFAKSGVDVVQIHRPLNDIGGAHTFIVILGFIGAASVMAGNLSGFITGALFRK